MSAADDARGPEAHPEADLDLLRGELDGCRAEIGRLRERDGQWKRLVALLVTDAKNDEYVYQTIAGHWYVSVPQVDASVPKKAPLAQHDSALAALLAEALEEEG